MNTDNFQWTDELVFEYLREIVFGELGTQDNHMEKFKQSKTIPKKEYEIISFRDKKNGHIDNIDSKRSLLNIHWWLNDGDKWEIYSVRRLSDGEVFTIGDWVKQVEPYCSDHRWHIGVFSLKDTRCFTIGVNISCIKKVEDKKPILTTEDGFDIYKDFYGGLWRVFTKPTSFEEWVPYNTGVPNQPIDGEKYFSTKEAAIKYIEENKPCLSKNEIHTWIKENMICGSLDWQPLNKLVKQKINK